MHKQTISAGELEKAFQDAKKLYGDIPIENSERSRLIASVAYGKDEHILDVGSYVSIYPVVLRILGMEVTILDSFPQRRYLDKAEKIDYVIENIYAPLGIHIIYSDAYSAKLSENSYDRVSAFEVFEHLVDSPKPILEKIYKSLRPEGKFIMSIPNIARLGSRLKVLLGKSPLPDYSYYFEQGNPFTGHRREMTTQEVKLMLVKSGFELEDIFTTNIFVPLPLDSLSMKWYHLLLDNIWLPTNLRRAIWAIARKPK